MVMSCLFVSVADYGEEWALNEHMERSVVRGFLHQCTKARPATQRWPKDSVQIVCDHNCNTSQTNYYTQGLVHKFWAQITSHTQSLNLRKKGTYSFCSELLLTFRDEQKCLSRGLWWNNSSSSDLVPELDRGEGGGGVVRSLATVRSCDSSPLSHDSLFSSACSDCRNWS